MISTDFLRRAGLLWLGIFSAGLVLCAPAPLAAQQDLPVQLSVLEMVNMPKQRPRLTVATLAKVSDLRVTIREAGQVVASKSLGSQGPGARREVNWNAPPGVHEYQFEVSGRVEGASATSVVESVVTVIRPLEIKLAREHVDVEARYLYLTMNNPAGHVDLTLYNTTGRSVHESSHDFAGKQPGQKLEVRWPELGQAVGRIELRVFDAAESWEGFELLPFSVEIPHEDVVFESGKWTIRDGERDKLDAAHGEILEAIAKHGSDLKARLYIIGHTDTVGSASDNQVLSQKRATAIARYFVERGGISLPVLAQGKGESTLAVKTTDNVDEARNRRAQYILAVQAPTGGDWKVVGP
ncbi:MAG: OmpA family protein [Myxococcales bacterium]|nr:OmpA family protein [Myxococcales bacterium]